MPLVAPLTSATAIFVFWRPYILIGSDRESKDKLWLRPGSRPLKHTLLYHLFHSKWEPNLQNELHAAFKKT